MILVSGATGRVGSAVCKSLLEAGVPFRVLLRDPAKFPIPASAAVEIVSGNLEDDAAVSGAMQGVSKAFLLTSNNPKQAEIEERFATSAAQSGVRHLVKVSSMEAAPDAKATLPKQHYASEQYIQSLGLDWTFLRPNFYMQNMLMYAASIANAGLFALPLGNAKTALVDTRDIGAAAAKILQDDGHHGAIYNLTGSELMSFEDVAQRMSHLLGKPVKYVAQTADEFRAVLEKFVPSAWQINAVCELFEEIAGGSLEEQTDDLERLLGRPPRSLDMFVTDHAKAFG